MSASGYDESPDEHETSIARMADLREKIIDSWMRLAKSGSIAHVIKLKEKFSSSSAVNCVFDAMVTGSHSEARTGTRTLTRNLNTDVWLQAKQDLISLLDPMDPIWGLRRPRKKAA
jgi:hypothetical protein